MQTLLQVHTISDPLTSRDVRRRVRDVLIAGGLGVLATDEMEVAVGEVLSNIQHAYRGDIGPVVVSVLRFQDAVAVLVTDRGDATKAPVIPQTSPPPTRRDGRGLYVTLELTDMVMIGVNAEGHGLEVAITKHLRNAPRVA